MTESEISEIKLVSPFEEINPENDNIDVHVRLRDGRIFSFVVATPNNVFWCMDNEELDYYFGTPMVFVKNITRSSIENAMRAIFSAGNVRWVEVYGTLQSQDL